MCKRSGINLLHWDGRHMTRPAGLRRQVIPWRQAAKSGAAELPDVVGLSASAGKLPHQLSDGQRQRVNIARAVMGRPKVLLVNEPTAALDHERSASIIGLLRQVTSEFGVATVMVTQDTEFVPLTDVVAIMRDGRLSTPSVPAYGHHTEN